MPFVAHVLRVLIASPGDTRDERDAVERALHEWNASRAAREHVVLLPRRWETNAVPVLGGSGQGAINKQLLDNADVVIALFDSRLGQATQRAPFLEQPRRSSGRTPPASRSTSTSRRSRCPGTSIWASSSRYVTSRRRFSRRASLGRMPTRATSQDRCAMRSSTISSSSTSERPR
jgi:hypothetical protein